ncbi:transporter substrate-binding domain-containing protein [Methyloligella solikamskensis]|uniref:Transporter substrate-binding domain-containing protein n=1 Tax=Methyloligella solikamskensis TaxID=1177756 RepID=A0ABW3J802_9HYPH
MTAISDGVLRVGLLFSQTGPTAFVERTQSNAARLAIVQINDAGGIGGKRIETIEYDAESNPQRFAELAERLLTEDGVSLIIGCYMSSTRQAIVPIVERHNALLAYPAPYEGFEYSPNVIYGGAVPNQHIVKLARYMMRCYGRRFYLVGTRYAFPIESNRVMITVVTEHGGEVVAERYVRLDSTRHEFNAIVEDIRKKQPDVVFCTVVGEAARRFYEAYEQGLTEKPAVAGLTITEAEVALMEPKLAAGHVTAATYFQSIDSAANRKFLAAYDERYGGHTDVNAMAETAYSLTRLLLRAVEEAGSARPEAIRRELCRLSLDSPQGPISMDPENNHFYLWPRIGKLSEAGQFEIVEESEASVRPDPYLIHHTIDTRSVEADLDDELTGGAGSS